MEPVLQIKGVSISFTQYSGGLQQAELPVISDLSLTVRPGQVVAVVGASGSGKACLRTASWGFCRTTAAWRAKFYTRARR